MISMSHLLFVFVILHVGLYEVSGCRRSIPAHDRPYYMEEVCQRANPYRITFNTAARVQPYNPKNTHVAKGMNCAVILDATIGRKVQVSVRYMNLTQRENVTRSDKCLTLFKGNKKHAICGGDTHWRNTWFRSDDGIITVKFSSDNLTNQWFDIVATSYTEPTGNENCTDFLCANRKCVIDALKCDQIDHCADGSDEWNKTCVSKPNNQPKKTWSTVSILVGFGLGFLSAAVFGLCLCLIRRCCTAPKRKITAEQGYEYPKKMMPVAREAPPEYMPFPPAAQTDGRTMVILEAGPFPHKK